MCLVDADIGTAVGDVGTILRTTDGGSTWTAQDSRTTVTLWGVEFADAYTGTVVGALGTILRTTDGGTTWVRQSSGSSRELSDASFIDLNTGAVVGEDGRIFHTTNGGSSWEERTTRGFYLNGVSFPVPHIGTAVGFNGTIMRTTDYGTSWTDQSYQIGYGFYAVSFSDANTGTIVGSNAPGIILRTTTGGTGMRPPPPTNLLEPVDGAISPTTATLSWESSSGALSYTLQVWSSPYFVTRALNESGIVEPSFQVAGLDPGSTYYWRVSETDSTGISGWSEVWSFTTSTTEVAIEEQVPTEFDLSQNYPNPFNPSTTIRYGLPERSHVRLEIFNMLGQLVALLVDGEQEAGYHQVTVEKSSLASGVYLYRLSVVPLARRDLVPREGDGQAGNFTETKRLMLLR